MGNNSGFHDFIEYFDKRPPRVFAIVAPLYAKGMSITDISAETGIARSSIYAALRANKHVLRPQTPVPFDRWRKGHGKTRSKPPYGYCFYKGVIIEDPGEFPTVQLIQSLWTQGMSISEITRELNRRGIPSRQKKLWVYGVVKGILKRNNSKL